MEAAGCYTSFVKSPQTSIPSTFSVSTSLFAEAFVLDKCDCFEVMER